MTTNHRSVEPDETVEDVQFLLGYSTGVVPDDVQEILDAAVHITRESVRAERGFGTGLMVERWRVRASNGSRSDLYVFLGGFDEAPVIAFLDETAALLIGNAVNDVPRA